MKEILQNVLDETSATFRSYKTLAERAIEQVSDEEFFRLLDEESNSIALIVKHLGGNLRSRWSDFLTTDGEKPDRDRDSEFAASREDTRAGLMQDWEDGWKILLDSLKSLKIDDLGKTIQIRGEDFTVVRALNRSLSHTAYHVGQITLLAKHFRGAEWKNLSVPKNKSAEFNSWLKEKKDKGNYLEAGSNFAESSEKEKSGRRE